MAYVLGTLFEAGSDTSTSTLLALIMALCINPAALASAQAELDRVVGDHRLPSLEDKADCPYIECLWKEVQRVGLSILVLSQLLNSTLGRTPAMQKVILRTANFLFVWTDSGGHRRLLLYRTTCLEGI